MVLKEGPKERLKLGLLALAGCRARETLFFTSRLCEPFRVSPPGTEGAGGSDLNPGLR